MGGSARSNIVEYGGDEPDGDFLAEQASRMLEEPRSCCPKAKDVLLQRLVGQVRRVAHTSNHSFDRHRSFDAFLRLAKGFDQPVMASTGCIRQAEDWTAGMSCYLFGLFLAQHGGTLASVDNDEQHVQFARNWKQFWPGVVTVHHADSVHWLTAFAGQIDCLYLDSMDAAVEGHAEHNLREAQAALPKLSQDALVLIDDTYWRRQVHGQG